MCPACWICSHPRGFSCCKQIRAPGRGLRPVAEQVCGEDASFWTHVVAWVLRRYRHSGLFLPVQKLQELQLELVLELSHRDRLVAS